MTISACHQQTFPGFYERLVEASIETLRFWEPEGSPYWGCFSGGKDSCVIKALAAMAGVAVVWHYSVETIAPPELTVFIKRHHPDVIRDKPKRSFFQAMKTNGVPTRVARWCCREFKESKQPKGSRIILGIRAAESPRRAANWQSYTRLRDDQGEAACPILHWRDSDVWRFIRENGLPYCKLYDEGFNRIGCIACPMSRDQKAHFRRWPTIGRLYKRAAREYWERRKAAGAQGKCYRFEEFEEFWKWWLGNGRLPGEPDVCQGQLEFWS